MDQTAALSYDPSSYDDIPTYVWNQNFDTRRFEDTIEQCNNDIWSLLKGAICDKLGVPARMSGCKHNVSFHDRKHKSLYITLLSPNLNIYFVDLITLPSNVLC